METITHTMSNGEYLELQKNFYSGSRGPSWLSEIVLQVIDEMAKRESEAWLDLHERFGTSPETHNIEIRWHTMQIIVTPRESKGDADD